MSRCIVFDQHTADAVQSRSGIRPEIRADQPGALMAMAVNSRAALAVLPAAEPGHVLLMRVSRPQARPAAPKVSSNMVPTGFLGLSDSIDMDSEPEQPKKWWQKITG
jgi:hypothetical protein